MDGLTLQIDILLQDPVQFGHSAATYLLSYHVRISIDRTRVDYLVFIRSSTAEVVVETRDWREPCCLYSIVHEVHRDTELWQGSDPCPRVRGRCLGSVRWMHQQSTWQFVTFPKLCLVWGSMINDLI
jgi:hypothetical protein